LDEAGLEFDFANGASGGTLNLAMYCRGWTGTQIADAWRNLSPSLCFEPNWRLWESLLKLDWWRDQVLRVAWSFSDAAWVNVRKGRAGARGNVRAAFSAFDVTNQRLVEFANKDMDEDRLLACVSIPMWFPPVKIDRELYLDSVFVTDANVESAIRRGMQDTANDPRARELELWIVWTVRTTGQWKEGFVSQYFQMIEMSANGRLQLILARIATHNEHLSHGGAGEFGPRRIKVKMLPDGDTATMVRRCDIPVHYLLTPDGGKLNAAVDMGVDIARKWCDEQGIPLPNRAADTSGRQLSFSEEMSGHVAFGWRGDTTRDYESAYQAALHQFDRGELELKLLVMIDDLDAFVADPSHAARLGGTVSYRSSQFPVEPESFVQLLVDDDGQRRMHYRVLFHEDERALAVVGFKEVGAGRNLWTETTTLYVHIERNGACATEDRVAQGRANLSFSSFARELATTRFGGRRGNPGVLVEFWSWFVGRLLGTNHT
jgi:hypothetical protein